MSTPLDATAKPAPVEAMKKAFAENPVTATILASLAVLALIAGLLIVIAIFKYADSILGALVALPFVFLIVYKIFTGFPAIFSAVIQVASIVVIGICILSLVVQHQFQAEGQSFGLIEKMKAVAAMREEFGIPEFISMLILTETGALIGIASGVAFGLIAEASAGIVTGSFHLGRVSDALKDGQRKPRP